MQKQLNTVEQKKPKKTHEKKKQERRITYLHETDLENIVYVVKLNDVISCNAFIMFIMAVIILFYL